MTGNTTNRGPDFGALGTETVNRLIAGAPLDAETLQRLVEAAPTYPGPRPEGSYLVTPEEVHPLAGAQLEAACADSSRVAMLSYGSNASPQRLRPKLAAAAGALGRVPVIACRLTGFDIGYSAHMSRHGAVPATLIASPPTTVHVHVLLVDAPQLAAIGATEFNYDFLELSPVELELDGGARRDSIHAYASKHGAVTIDGRPVVLAAIEAENRAYPALTTREMIEAVRDRLEPGEDLDTFIARNISDAPARERRTAEVKRTAAPLGL